MDCVNLALYIVIQCGVSGLAWGTTGVGKSACMKALAEALGYKFFCFIPSQHMPEDIGGLPHINVKQKIAEMVPMAWIRALTEPNWLLMLDEATTAPQAMKPALLTALNERKIGDLEFHPSTIIVGAANPPEMAPNGAPLEASMLNRLYHHQWEFPFDQWYNGMIAGGNFKACDDLPVVGDFSAYIPKWTAIIGRLLYKHPEIRETTVIPEGELAFPSPRQWYNLARCLAGCEKVGAKGGVQHEIAKGMVGDSAAGILMRYIAARDLYDPAEVVDGKVVVDFANDRFDQLVYLPIGIMETLADDPSKSRIYSGVSVLIDMAENGMLDSVGPVLAEITTTYPDYRMPKRMTDRFAKIAKQIAGVN